MFPTPTSSSVPAAMPVLRRGKHADPSHGACFMEYTSVLAGEPFTDEPRCVDAELAAVLRHANDALPDAERTRLVPLLGRAIGLVVAPPLAAQLHREVAVRYTGALGYRPGRVENWWYRRGRNMQLLWWRTLFRHTAYQYCADKVGELVRRLELLHGCYEQALQELGLPRAHPYQPAGWELPLVRV